MDGECADGKDRQSRPNSQFVARLRRDLVAGQDRGDSTPDVLAGIEELLDHPNRYAFPSIITSCLPVVCGVGMVVLMIVLNGGPAILVAAIVTMVVFVAMAIRVSDEPFRLRRAIAGRLAAAADATAVPLTVKLMRQVHRALDSSESASVSFGEEFRRAAANLYRQMCRMPQAEARMIVDANRWWFYAATTDLYNLGPNVSVIEAQAELIRYLGDVEARPQVAKLARTEAATPHEKQARAIAQRLLPELDVLIEKQKPGKELLRAVESSEVVALLRPASGASTPDALLLRPEDGG
jgi:hypothetical protein